MCVCVRMCECEKIFQFVSALYMIFFVQVEAMKRAQYYFQVMCFMSISFTRLGGGGSGRLTWCVETRTVLGKLPTQTTHLFR